MAIGRNRYAVDSSEYCRKEDPTDPPNCREEEDHLLTEVMIPEALDLCVVR